MREFSTTAFQCYISRITRFFSWMTSFSSAIWLVVLYPSKLAYTPARCGGVLVSESPRFSFSAIVVDAEGAPQSAVSALGAPFSTLAGSHPSGVSPFLFVYPFSGFLLRSPLEEGWRLGFFLSPSPIGFLHWLGHELRPGEAAWHCGFEFQIYLLRFRL